MKKSLLFILVGCALVFSSFGYHGCCHKRSYKAVLAHCGWHRHSSHCNDSKSKDDRNCRDTSRNKERSNCDSNSNCNSDSNRAKRFCPPCK